MCVCVCVCVCACAHVCVCVSITCISATYVLAAMAVRTWTHVSAQLCSVCVCVCVHACARACVCVCSSGDSEGQWCGCVSGLPAVARG